MITKLPTQNENLEIQTVDMLLSPVFPDMLPSGSLFRAYHLQTVALPVPRDQGVLAQCEVVVHGQLLLHPGL